jgi:putative ABC transport system permease protein
MMGALSLFSSWPQKTTVNPSLKRMKTPLPLRRRQEEQLMKKNSTIESKREKILSFLRGLRRMLPTANRSRMLIVSSILLFMFTASSRPAFASSTSAGQSNLPVQLTWRNLLKAASIVAATGGLGLAVSGVPEVARALLAACARCTLQLYLIGGFVLTRMLILAQARPLLVWSWIFVTALVAAQEASSRVEYTYPRLWRHVALAVLAGAATVMGSTVVFRILGDIQPWYAPRTWIPVAGMLFGNSLSAIALAAGTVTREVVVNRDVVELRLILGATWKEALQSVLAATYSTSLTPVMNSLSVAGIVHIPGMMTGAF